MGVGGLPAAVRNETNEGKLSPIVTLARLGGVQKVVAVLLRFYFLGLNAIEVRYPCLVGVVVGDLEEAGGTKDAREEQDGVGEA